MEGALRLRVSGWQGAHYFVKANLGVYLLLHVTGIPNVAQGVLCALLEETLQ